VKVARFARHGLTPAVLTGVELGRFTAHGLTPAVLTAWSWEDWPETAIGPSLQDRKAVQIFTNEYDAATHTM